jgi:hypothetical protein
LVKTFGIYNIIESHVAIHDKIVFKLNKELKGIKEYLTV